METEVTLQYLQYAPGMFIACAAMVILVVVQSILLFRLAWQQAKKIGMPRELCISGIRSAAITSFGPSLAPIIVMLALINTLGAPTAWMRLCDMGAGRTELAVATASTALIGANPTDPATFTPLAFSYAQWGMALNNVWFMVIALILGKNMGNAVAWLNRTYDPKWVALFMKGAYMGLFAYLLSNSIVSNSGRKPSNWIAAAVAAGSMVFFSKVLKNSPRLQELSIGISMAAGMAAGVISVRLLGVK